MKKAKKFLLAIAVVLVMLVMLPYLPVKAATSMVPSTAYADQFISACEGQAWFIDAVESILSQNQKTLSTIKSSDDLKVIKSLGLKGKKIEGHIPEAIGELKELRYLFLSDNKLGGSIPDSLFKLPKLQNIDLSDNEYSGSIPEEFGTMQPLKYLNLRGNRYTGTVPGKILENSTITYFDVSSNQLSGKLPEDLSHMTALEYLAVSDNSWSEGELPDLSSLKDLKVLSAWNCQLTGELPESLYALSSLQVLDLEGNLLSGELSEKIESLDSLQQLSLAKNQLRGTIPEAFSLLENISILDLSRNFLRGTFPDADWENKEIYIEENYLTGNRLSEAAENAENFSDELENAQYQLTAKKAVVQISKTDTTNIYEILQNKCASIINKEKPLLRPDEYTITYDVEKVSCLITEKGIFVKAITDISEDDGCFITIQIKGNAGSAASTVMIRLTTAPVRQPSTTPGDSDGGEADAYTEYHKAYVSGYPDGRFRPDSYITREEAATMIMVSLEINPATPASATFPDVPLSSWSSKWIEAAAQRGYLKGYSDGTFGPGKNITRAEMASILVKIVSDKTVTRNAELKDFVDVPDGQWYTNAVRLAALYELVTGYPDGTFRPEQQLTRAEAVTMVNHMLSRDYRTAEELQGMACPFSDVSTTYWGYGNIMEAALDHNH